MFRKLLTTIAAAASVALLAGQVAAAPSCGDNTGNAATGEPILVGGIYGQAPPGDFSASTDAANAYFNCVNANGGIHGRPIKYLLENDQWNPEMAAQAASKLVKDEGVVALVGNGSFIEMAVNAPTYAAENIMSMASACAISECFESSNIVSTNQGPLPSNLGAVQYAVEELGTSNVACIGLNIPSNGVWSCDYVSKFMDAHGGSSTFVPLNPGAPDVNSAVLEAISSGADTILTNLPAGLAIAVLKAAEEQDLRDAYKWISPTTLYDKSVPAALGDYWDGAIYVSAEITPFEVDGPDQRNMIAVMDAYARPEDPRDTFAQAGYLSAKFFVDTLMAMDPSKLDDRASVTAAIKGISGYKSDMLCGPYYVGDSDFHMPNHSGYMVQIKGGGYEVLRNCFEYDSAYFEPHIALEKKLGLR